MKKLCAVLFVAVVAFLVTGCQTHHSSGSREYVPGKGWIHND